MDSAVFLPALPFVVAGSLAGGELWASQVSKKEANSRPGILETCMQIRSYRGLFSKMDQIQHFRFENLTNTIQASFRRTLKLLKKAAKKYMQYFEEHNIFELSPTSIISKEVIPYLSNESGQNAA